MRQVRFESKADLTLGSDRVSSCLDSGHGVRISDVMEEARPLLSRKRELLDVCAEN